MNWKLISRNIGYALLVSALFMLISVVISFINGTDSACAALIISFTITFISGIFPFIFVRNTKAITLKEGYVIIALSWLLSFVFGMLPYALWGGPFTLQNAWFESVSGFTTTGATILDNVEALPKSLLFWRSATHFIGGLGVVVFLVLVIPGSSPMKMRLTNMDLTNLSKSGYSVRTNKIAYVFAYVYIGQFLLAFLSYWAAGMPLFDAVCHAMSVAATGGFSTRNASIAAFDSRLIEGLTMLFMFMSSIHFGLIFMAVVGKSLKPFNNPVLKFYVSALLLFSFALSVGLKINGICSSWGSSLWNGFFEILCVASTTGFAIIDNAQWPLSLSVLVMFMAVMCGCAGSTSGGVKSDRVLLLLKSAGAKVNSILHPSGVSEVKLGRRIFKREDVAPHLLYISLYGLLLAVSVFLSLVAGVDSSNAFAASVSSLGNVGPAIGELGSMGSFNGIPMMAKFIFTIDMFLGRIEIFPVLAILAMLFDKRER